MRGKFYGKHGTSPEERFTGSLVKSGDCWEWVGYKIGSGYGRLRVGRVRMLAHRYALEKHLGRPLAAGFFACHTCPNRACVNPAHLYEGTASDNARDSVLAGTNFAANMSNATRNKGVPKRRGELHYFAKLTERDVREIRRRKRAGESSGVIAKDYAVARSTIKRAINGRTWKHLSESSPQD